MPIPPSRVAESQSDPFRGCSFALDVILFIHALFISTTLMTGMEDLIVTRGMAGAATGLTGG